MKNAKKEAGKLSKMSLAAKKAWETRRKKSKKSSRDKKHGVLEQKSTSLTPTAAILK